MKRLLELVAYILIITTSSLISARELRVKQLSHDTNIPSQYITHVSQLESGYLLVSTNLGTRLFDGYQFNPILPAEKGASSPLDTHVYKATQDSQGNIWFATTLGLFQLKKNGEQLIKMAHKSGDANSLSNNNVRYILEDSVGNIWFATLDGVSKYTHKNNRFINYDQFQPLAKDKPLGRIYTLLEEEGKYLWIGSSSGLFNIDLKTGVLAKVGGLVNKSYITSAIKTDLGEIWFGGDTAGIFRLNLETRAFSLHNVESSSKTGIGGSKQSNSISSELEKDDIVNNHNSERQGIRDANGPQLKSNNVWALHQDSSGLIWIGYWAKGVSVYNPRTKMNYFIKHRLHDKHSLPSPSIEQITEDASGLVWIATSDGLASFNPASFNVQHLRHDPEDSLSINKSTILSLVEDRGGVVWVGTEEGLESWDPESDHVTHYYHDESNPDSIKAGAIWMVEKIDDDNLILATDKGVALFNKATGKTKHYDNLKSRDGTRLNLAFYALASAGNGWFYVSSSASTIHLIHPLSGESKLIFDAHDNPLTHETEYFQVLLPTGDKSLWLGSTTGLYLLDMKSGEITSFNATSDTHQLSGNVINDLHLSQDGVLWVATSTGGINLIELKSKKITVLSAGDELPSNEILALTPSTKENIWFTSGHHFGYINSTTLKSHFYPLLSNKEKSYSEGALIVGREGDVFMGGNEVSRFHSSKHINSQYTPPIRFTKISRLHKPMKTFLPLKELQTIQFYPEDTMVTFNFASLDYAFPEYNRYRYKLDGVDSYWLTPDFEHHATYTHLPAGKFTLRVQASNRDGVWGADEALLSMIVYPPPWKSQIAYFSYSLGLILLLLYLWRNHKKKREIELQTISTIKQSEARFRDVLWGSGDELWRWDLPSNMVYRTKIDNKQQIFKESEITMDALLEDIHPDDRAVVKDISERHISGKQDYYEAQFRLLDKKNDTWMWTLSRGRIVERDISGLPTLIAGTSKDINDIKYKEKQLRYLANYDQLTLLPNRTLFQEHLNHAINIATRFKDKLGLLFFDLDGFKLINDLQGHAVGDELLKAVAQRLNLTLRDSDKIARLGGDEFAIIVERINQPEEVMPTLERIMSALSRSFDLNSQSIDTSVSIGVAVFPEDGNTPTALLKHADIAMYEAKRNGKNSYCFYNPSMDALLIRRLDMEQQIDTAIKFNQFETFYQPRVCAQTNRLKGFEALIRWRHPERGLVSPIEFIPVAEETGQILSIGSWVLKDACQQAATWYQKGWRGCISVNIAALQFQQSDLVADTKRILAMVNIPAEHIEFEITEGTLIKNLELTRNILVRLKSIGIRIALDDFGTGYSSLSYLQQLPIDVLKIDRSFIKQINLSSKSSRLSVAIINMAHSLDIEVVAEGIEEESQLAFIRNAGCEEYQGYLYSKPLPVSEIKLDL